MTKVEFKTHINLNWKYYILGIIASFLLSLTAITIASYPTKKEKVAIFLTCYKTEGNIKEYFDSIKPEYLETIELNIKHKEDTYYGTVIKGYRKTADIMIIPESKINYIITKNCLVLSDDIMNELSDKTFDYYSFQDVKYGIKIYSKDTNEGILKDYVVFNKEGSEEDYYLFININSMHLGELNNSKYDGAVIILKEILNYEA